MILSDVLPGYLALNLLSESQSLSERQRSLLQVRVRNMNSRVAVCKIEIFDSEDPFSSGENE